MGRLRQHLKRLTRQADRDYYLAIPQRGGGVARFKPEEWLEAFGHETSRLREPYRTGSTTKARHPLTEAVFNTTSEKATHEYRTLTFLAAYAEGEEECDVG